MRGRTVRTARYPVPTDPPRRWTARLCRRADGAYYVDYAVPDPQPGGRVAQRRVRVLLAGPEDFDEWVEERIPAQAAAWLAPQAPRLGEGDPLLRDLFGWYVESVQVARGDTEGTRDQNRVILRRFADWLAARDVLTAGELAEQAHLVESYAAHLATGKRAGTVKKELAIIRAVFRIAAERGVIPAEPVRGRWPVPKAPDTVYEGALTPAEFQALLARLKDGTRNVNGVAAKGQSSLYNLVRFMAHVGCRPSDACGLLRKRVDLDGDEPTALIRQHKTGKLVAVALSAPAVAAVRDELARGVRSEYVFTDRRGRPVNPQTLYTSLAWHCAKLGLRHITPRMFRQGVVSLLLASGVDQEYVQRITGHRSDAIGAYVRTVQGAAHGLANRLAALLAAPAAEGADEGASGAASEAPDGVPSGAELDTAG